MADSQEYRSSSNIINAYTEFISSKRILEYLENTLLTSLSQNEEIGLYTLNAKFQVQNIPINLIDVPIYNGKEIVSYERYLTDFVNKIANTFQETLTDEKKSFFERRRKDRFINDLKNELSKEKVKRLSGKSYIFCDNIYVIRILSQKDINGNDYYVRKFKINPATNQPYTEKDVENFMLENKIPEKKIIDLTYNSFSINDIPKFFTYKFKNKSSEQEKNARESLCFLLQYYIEISSMDISQLNNLEPPSTIDINILKQFSYDNDDISDLIDVYKKFSNNPKLFFENGVLRTTILSYLKSSRSKPLLSFKYSKNLNDGLEGSFYAERIFNNDDPGSIFMKDLLVQFERSLVSKSVEYPILPETYVFKVSNLNLLLKKLFGKTLSDTSAPLNKYSVQINNFLNAYEISENILNGQINEIFGEKEKSFYVSLPKLKLNEEEKKWVSNLRDVTMKRLEKQKIINQDPNLINYLEKSIELLTVDDFTIRYQNYKVDFSSRVEGELNFIIQNIKIFVSGRTEVCSNLHESGRDSLIINFFKPFFEPFRSENNTVQYSVKMKPAIIKKVTQNMLFLVVEYSSSNDTYDATKFRTQFSINKNIPDDEDNKFYTVKWEKTKIQREALSGTGGEITFKIYSNEEIKGAKLEYPFIDNVGDKVLKKHLDTEIDFFKNYVSLSNIRNPRSSSRPNFSNLQFEMNPDFKRTQQSEEIIKKNRDFYALMNQKNIYGFVTQEKISPVTSEIIKSDRDYRLKNSKIDRSSRPVMPSFIKNNGDARKNVTQNPFGALKIKNDSDSEEEIVIRKVPVKSPEQFMILKDIFDPSFTEVRRDRRKRESISPKTFKNSKPMAELTNRNNSQGRNKKYENRYETPSRPSSRSSSQFKIGKGSQDVRSNGTLIIKSVNRNLPVGNNSNIPEKLSKFPSKRYDSPSPYMRSNSNRSTSPSSIGPLTVKERQNKNSSPFRSNSSSPQQREKTSNNLYLMNNLKYENAFEPIQKSSVNTFDAMDEILKIASHKRQINLSESESESSNESGNDIIVSDSDENDNDIIVSDDEGELI